LLDERHNIDTVECLHAVRVCAAEPRTAGTIVETRHRHGPPGSSLAPEPTSIRSRASASAGPQVQWRRTCAPELHVKDDDDVATGVRIPRRNATP
jgi:hypothetical protein